MSVDAHHPDYDIALPDWELMRAAISGDRTVKDNGETFLPKPSGFDAMPDPLGDKAYEAYKTRAQFPQITGPTVRGLGGVIHRTEAQITLPDGLKYLEEAATPDGLPLEALHRIVVRELLSTGRYGLLADPPAQGGDPLLAGYTAEAIINWSRWGDFFVLNESQLVREDYAWTEEIKYRELVLDNGVYIAKEHVASGNSFEVGQPLTPRVQGGAALKAIPFTVIGSTTVLPDVDEIPLLAVAQAAMAAYRLDADYRHQLFNSGQETLVCSGIPDKDKPTVVGAGVVIAFSDPNAKAMYVGPSGATIEAHRTAIQDELQKAVLAGAKMFGDSQKSAESGDALRLRYASQTASLVTVSQAAASGLERALRSIAVFKGLDPNSVIVKPNLSFIDATLSPDDAVKLMALWQGGGISKKTLYENLQQGEIASAERTFEEEESLIQDEMPTAAELNAGNPQPAVPGNGGAP